jgi:hypothetical protein
MPGDWTSPKGLATHTPKGTEGREVTTDPWDDEDLNPGARMALAFETFGEELVQSLRDVIVSGAGPPRDVLLYYLHG